MEYARHAGKVFTAVCNDWQKLLAEDDYKQLVIDALKFRVSRGEVKVGAYVIMPACPFVNVGRLTNILLAYEGL